MLPICFLGVAPFRAPHSPNGYLQHDRPPSRPALEHFRRCVALQSRWPALGLVRRTMNQSAGSPGWLIPNLFDQTVCLVVCWAAFTLHYIPLPPREESESSSLARCPETPWRGEATSRSAQPALSAAVAAMAGCAVCWLAGESCFCQNAAEISVLRPPSVRPRMIQW
jgi:hypothetical protein